MLNLKCHNFKPATLKLYDQRMVDLEFPFKKSHYLINDFRKTKNDNDLTAWFYISCLQKMSYDLQNKL